MLAFATASIISPGVYPLLATLNSACTEPDAFQQRAATVWFDSEAEVGSHSWIKHSMLNNYHVYYQSHSRIRINIFDSDHSECCPRNYIKIPRSGKWRDYCGRIVEEISLQGKGFTVQQWLCKSILRIRDRLQMRKADSLVGYRKMESRDDHTVEFDPDASFFAFFCFFVFVFCSFLWKSSKCPCIVIFTFPSSWVNLCVYNVLSCSKK